MGYLEMRKLLTSALENFTDKETDKRKSNSLEREGSSEAMLFLCKMTAIMTVIATLKNVFFSSKYQKAETLEGIVFKKFQHKMEIRYKGYNTLKGVITKLE